MQRSLDVFQYHIKNQGSLNAAAVTAVIFYIETELNMDHRVDQETIQTLTDLTQQILRHPATTDVMTSIIKYYHLLNDHQAQILLRNILVEIEDHYYDWCKRQKGNLFIPSIRQKNSSKKSNHAWSQTTIEMFRRKKLSHTVFKPVDGLTLESDLSEHAAWAYENIYSHDYPDGKPRYAHGIQHVTRAASYVPIFINLFRKHGDQDAFKLDNQQLKLLQIAALFHDAARENDSKDLWDHESGVMLYLYLTRVLGVEKYIASPIVVATAEKDPEKSKGYAQLIENSQGDIEYVYRMPRAGTPFIKSIQQKIIHDADCLDIIRARPHFKAEYLDFYKQFCVTDSNGLLLQDNLALNELAKLITEARSLINIHGDGYVRGNMVLKSRYQHTYAWQRMLMDIDKDKHRLLYTLGGELLPALELDALLLIDLTPYRRELGMTVSNLRAAMRESLLFVRGIGSPSSVTHNGKETFAALELRKMFRTRGIKTNSHKPNATNKLGNPLRSLTPIGYGGGVYASAGLLILEPPFEKISCISTRDLDSGRGKESKKLKFFTKQPRPTQRQIEVAHNTLNRKMKMGGDSYRFTKQPKDSREMKRLAICNSFSHPEALIDFESCDGIYFSSDPTMHNHNITNNPLPYHQHTPLLQAIYIRELYKKLWQIEQEKYIKHWGDEVGIQRFLQRFGQRDLPIFEYSGVHDTLDLVDESQLTHAKIIQLWIEMCEDYLDTVPSNYPQALRALPLEILKINVMLGNEINRRASYMKAADESYPDELQAAVNAALSTCVTNRIEEYENTFIDYMREHSFTPLQKSEMSQLNAKRIILKLLKTEKSKQKFLSSNFDNLFSKFSTYQENYFLQPTNYWGMAIFYEVLCDDKEYDAAHFLKNIAFNLVEKTLRSSWKQVTPEASECFVNTLTLIRHFNLSLRFNDYIKLKSLHIIKATNWADDTLSGYARTVNYLLKSNDIDLRHFPEILTSLKEVILRLRPFSTEAIKLGIIKDEILQIRVPESFRTTAEELCTLIDNKIADATQIVTVDGSYSDLHPTISAYVKKYY